MATEERVVLIAELKDEMSALLDGLSNKLDETAKKTEESSKKQEKATEKATKSLRQQVRDAVKSATDFKGHWQRSTSAVTSSFRKMWSGIKSIPGNIISGVKKLPGQLRSLTGQIGGALGKMAQAAGRGGKKIGSAIASEAKKAASAGLKTLALAGAALGGMAIGGGISRALNIEDAQAKLAGLGHSAQSIDQIMSDSMASVKGTAFGLGDAATAAAGAVAAGVKPGKELERTLSLIGDGATIAGVSFGDMGSIFNKIAAGGVIQGEELAQLGDKGIPILQFLAAEMGVSAQEVKKLASEGKVDFATFQNAMEKGLGGAAQSSGKTFRGAMANTRAALGRIGETMLKPFLTIGKAIFNAVTPVFDSINTRMKPVMEKVQAWADTLGPKLEAMGAKAAKFIESFSAGGLLETLGQFAPVIGAIAGGLLAMGSGGLAGMLGPLGAFLPTISPVLGVILGLIAASPELRAALGGLFQQLLPVIMQVADTFGAMFRQLMPAFTGLASVLAPIIPMIGNFIAQLVSALLPILPPIAGLLAKVVGIVAGLIPVLMPVIQLILDMAISVIEALLPALDPLFTALSAILEPVGKLIGSLMSLIMTVLEPLMPLVITIAEVIGTVLGAAIEALMPIITFLVEALTNLVTFLEGPLGAAVEWISGLLGGLADIVGVIADGIGGFIGDVAKNVGNFFSGGGDGGSASGGGVMKFAGGGVAPGYAPGHDTIAALLSPGESVLVPELTRAIGPANIIAANREASNGRPAAAGPAAARVAAATVQPRGGNTVDARVIAEGAVQINVQTTGEGISPDDLDDLEQRMADILRAWEKGDY
ncbi:tape measure protein [Arthrobacter sulfonylureivorans]|uniref:tape measure protein n=1 Tax=Arthrobacter sulfonylureivorans TaxID=2486855 RepID=UPI0039E6ABA8